ncbi:MAG: hypothetical protein U1F37_03540 [Alphaproteobacteria bacterium]
MARGLLLIPMSFLVRRAVGIDHPDVIARLRALFPSPDLETIDGNFIDYRPKAGEAYDKILVYSVVSSLPTPKRPSASSRRRWAC